MDNAQKAIMVGVGLFITIIIISAVMLISSAGQDLIDQSMDELNNISDSLSRQLYIDYAGGEFSGTEVIAAVKKYAGQANLTITVKSSSSDAGTAYTSSNAGSVTSKVVSTAKYTSAVTMTDNVVSAITFTKK